MHWQAAREADFQWTVNSEQDEEAQATGLHVSLTKILLTDGYGDT
jgi:hypothetical protein